ncbi:unnamed protein product [Penicillium salamii]|uniref:Uncharacterized protein n=1 Tax=Penicillium salamii TaxID=1612424 RepID=A0A9W4NF62_9EURO|nr:unnamed protein product [Penicillium salamii]
MPVRITRGRALFPPRATTCIFVIFIWLLFRHLPSPPVTQNNTRADRPRPKNQAEERPHFLFQSPFRKSPDLQYERQISDALERLAQGVLSQNHGNSRSEERIWQIAANDAMRGTDSRDFEARNDEWAYTLVNDKKAIEFVTTELSTIPDIAEVYKSYPHNVLRADFLRYLLLWYYGGFYADIDVFPARSIKTCSALRSFFPMPEDSTQKAHHNVSLVVGIEVDEPFASPQFMRDWHWARSYGLIQYTMYAPRRFSPLLREAIVHVLSHTKKQNKSYGSLFRSAAYDEKTILGVTGPDVFTDAILETLSSSLPSNHPLIQQSVAADVGIDDLVSPTTGEIDERVSWAPFHHIRDPVCVQDDEAIDGTSHGGLCVLPVNVWGNGQRHSRAGGFNDIEACVNHRFGRTWKKGWWEYIFG